MIDSCYDAPRRNCIGLSAPPLALFTISLIAIMALTGGLIAQRYPVTPPILGYGAIIAGAGSYLVYLTQHRNLLRDHPQLFMGMAAIIATPLIIVGALCVSGHLSLIHTAKAICVIGGVVFVPMTLFVCGLLCSSCIR